MIVKFIVAAIAILVAGPMVNEGGAEAIQEKGFKEAVVYAIENPDPVELNHEWYKENTNQ